MRRRLNNLQLIKILIIWLQEAENFDVIAERKLIIDIKNVPSETKYIGFTKKFKHAKVMSSSINFDKKQISYIA